MASSSSFLFKQRAQATIDMTWRSNYLVPSVVTSAKLEGMKKRYLLPTDLSLRVPTSDEPYNYLPPQEICFFEGSLEMGLHLPIHPFIGWILAYFGL